MDVLYLFFVLKVSFFFEDNGKNSGVLMSLFSNYYVIYAVFSIKIKPIVTIIINITYKSEIYKIQELKIP